ncbi:hypothetical protein [Lacrimispora indolis]|uniref:hypothetical protein n=1 Tax=Lacrimispora indolis TaxID=69825 RepID=UPI00045E76D4|nr:hypothetical protein [Lacrimispora indolis]
MRLRDVLAVIDDNETVAISLDYKSLKSCEKLRREHLIDLLDMTVKGVKTESCSMLFITGEATITSDTTNLHADEIEHFLRVEIEVSRNRIESKEEIRAFNGVGVGPEAAKELNKRHIAFCQQLLDMIH